MLLNQYSTHQQHYCCPNEQQLLLQTIVVMMMVVMFVFSVFMFVFVNVPMCSVLM